MPQEPEVILEITSHFENSNFDKIDEAKTYLEGFSKSFSMSLSWKFSVDILWGSISGVKRYSEQKRFMGQDF